MDQFSKLKRLTDKLIAKWNEYLLAEANQEAVTDLIIDIKKTVEPETGCRRLPEPSTEPDEQQGYLPIDRL